MMFQWNLQKLEEEKKTKKSTSLIHKQIVCLEHANKHKRSVINNEKVSVQVFGNKMWVLEQTIK